ncbi:MAG: hypothetical protein ACE5JL_09710 [Dehalococcoidia bacterium]
MWRRGACSNRAASDSNTYDLSNTDPHGYSHTNPYSGPDAYSRPPTDSYPYPNAISNPNSNTYTYVDASPSHADAYSSDADSNAGPSHTHADAHPSHTNHKYGHGAQFPHGDIAGGRQSTRHGRQKPRRDSRLS